jgi:uncharacterized coiled-coil protein SlyX
MVTSHTFARWLLLPLALTLNINVSAAEPDSMDLSQVIQLLQEQQKEVAAQRKLIDSQSNQLAKLKQELKGLQSTNLASIAVIAPSTPLPQPDLSTKAEQAVETGKTVAAAQADDPTHDLLSDFSSAWPIPGSSAVLSIGGYVKTSVVYNYDPLEIKDRFIVGSIPVDDTSDALAVAQSSITVSQSRLNFDLHEATDVGILRAFIEGDFAEDNDTFRLRHAFGQWHRVLAGKTWSAFVDTDASPEEVDFEGLNGRVNVRQAQVRIMPRYGASYQFQLSMEDPNPQIQNGQGVTEVPDFVLSGRFQPHERLHLKMSLLARQIRGQQEPEFGGGVDKANAWGVSLSGRFNTPMLDKRDSLLFQLNGGTGIGRYVNDLSSIGNYDGIFDPRNGDLELFDVLAGYVSWQHWWRGNLRSNFTFGMVDVDNPGFVEGEAYKQTMRFSSNVLWTPTPRINIGLEYLWGVRENENGDDGDATQIQASAQYNF